MSLKCLFKSISWDISVPVLNICICFFPGNTYNYDIALIKIKPKEGGGIKFSDHVQPACLPEETTEYIVDTKCHISGWGKTEQGELED